MGLEVCPAHLMAVPLAAGVRGQAEIVFLGQQKLGMLEGGNTVCNTLPGEAAGPWRWLVWVVLLCFPSCLHCLEASRRNNHGSVPS